MVKFYYRYLTSVGLPGLLLSGPTNAITNYRLSCIHYHLSQRFQNDHSNRLHEHIDSLLLVHLHHPI
jgi:hypothetical protein